VVPVLKILVDKRDRHAALPDGGGHALDRIAFGAAALLYVAAMVAELMDRPLLAALGRISGHTLKHLLGTATATVLVDRPRHRLRR
jgi:hypothetical protein